MAELAYYDAHNHLQDTSLDIYREKMLVELSDAGVRGVVVNGTSQGDWASVLRLSERFPWITPSLGVHPWDCGNRGDGWLENLRTFLALRPELHVGEIGLDRWMLDRAKEDDPRLEGLRRAPIDEQIEVFSAQLGLAVEYDRAVSIHCLDAYGTLLETLRASSVPSRGFLLHAYGGPPQMVKSFAELGAFFSFNGAFLDSRRVKVQEAFREVPLERLLVETDAPAMIPPETACRAVLPKTTDGFSINHPVNIVGIYEGLSNVLGVPLETLAAQCEANYTRFFAPKRLNSEGRLY